MALITVADYPAVRAALDISLDAAAVPDAVIVLSIYHGAAELDVLARVPDAEGRAEPDLSRLRNAVIFLTAAKMARAVPAISAERTPTHEYTRHEVNWTKRGVELLADAERELAQVTVETPPVEETDEIPPLFGLASGRRGR